MRVSRRPVVKLARGDGRSEARSAGPPRERLEAIEWRTVELPTVTDGAHAAGVGQSRHLSVHNGESDARRLASLLLDETSLTTRQASRSPGRAHPGLARAVQHSIGEAQDRTDQPHYSVRNCSGIL